MLNENYLYFYKHHPTFFLEKISYFSYLFIGLPQAMWDLSFLTRD